MKELQLGPTMLVLTQGDITRVAADAIVNAANSGLLGGGGVDGAIHRAGGPAILQECRTILASQGRLPPGRAVATTAGRLPARFVIHTVGPIWQGGTRGEPDVLAGAYRSSLELARGLALTTVAFPSISTGAYGYPVDQAARVALRTVARFLSERPLPVQRVTFVLHDEHTLDAYTRAMENLAAAHEDL
ncbi:MAG: O-acetyl-ADP-ribose deacetylase [Dehalococcoidia bacterium]|jgi:O-acetyl-ADP-ribose deacetylase (regulator of RNase III)|nr:O-acetyl-ADP-ribose deacetylase [Dehalococcoidia bacterium]